MEIMDYTERTNAVDHRDHYRMEDSSVQPYLIQRERGHCPNCESELELVCHIRRPITDIELQLIRFRRPQTPHYMVDILTHSCPHCGWWRVSNVQEEIAVRDYIFPTMRKFDAADKGVPLHVLGLELRRRTDALQHIHPEAMERFVGDVMKDVLDVEIHHVGRTGDGGIDLFYGAGEKKFAFQVKRRTDKYAVEGVKLVREFLGAMLLKGFSGGTIVTTAERFSAGAAQEATLAVERGLVRQFQLIDRKRFVEMFRFNSRRATWPWEVVFEDVARVAALAPPYETLLNKSSLRS